MSEQIDYNKTERLTREQHLRVELPPCKCGLIPKTRTRSGNPDWGHDEFQFIECECGMRTVEKDFVYNRNENLQAIIEIWKQLTDESMWTDWPKTTGQMFVEDLNKNEMWIGTIEEKRPGKILVWGGSNYYAMEVPGQLRFHPISYPKSSVAK